MEKTTLKFNMNEVLKSKEEYIELRDYIFDCIKEDLDNRRILTSVIVDNEEYEMTYGNALTLLVCYRVFLETKCKFSNEFLFDPSDVNNINDYFDTVLDYTLYNLEDEDLNMVKEVILVIISDLANISGVINTKNGNNISIKSLLDLAKEIPEFNEILHLKLPEGNLQFNEIENFIKKNLDRTIEILKQHPNCLNVFLNSDAGINKKQLGQVINIIGAKPDLDGSVIPYPINSSFIRGIDLPSFFIVSKGARKALITNSTQVRTSGYLTRKSSSACLDTHSITKGFCGTKHLVPIEITNKSVLKRLNGRYYKNENDEVKLLTMKDTNLIGQTLNFYSPLTCSCENSICERCYGKLSKFNKDINIGIVAVLILTEILTQRLLSSKHLLTVVSKKIEWGETFEDYLSVNIDNISYQNSNIKIKINKIDIEEDELTEVMSFKNMTIIDKKKEYEIESPIVLNINKQVLDIFKYYDSEEDAYIIQGLQDSNIFYYVMDNIELSTALHAIKDILDKNDYLREHTLNESINDMLVLIEEAGIKINSVHLELILRCLCIVDGGRQEFNKEEYPKYSLYKIKDAILRGNSLSKSLTFEELLKQLSTLEFDIFNKNGDSLLDGLL